VNHGDTSAALQGDRLRAAPPPASLRRPRCIRRARSCRCTGRSVPMPAGGLRALLGDLTPTRFNQAYGERTDLDPRHSRALHALGEELGPLWDEGSLALPQQIYDGSTARCSRRSSNCDGPRIWSGDGEPFRGVPAPLASIPFGRPLPAASWILGRSRVQFTK